MLSVDSERLRANLRRHVHPIENFTSSIGVILIAVRGWVALSSGANLPLHVLSMDKNCCSSWLTDSDSPIPSVIRRNVYALAYIIMAVENK
jgi:hypothetical protein